MTKPNINRSLYIAELERKENSAIIDESDFEFLTNVGPPIQGGNIFANCKRVHVKGCNISFLEIDGDLVAFIEAKGN